MSIQLQAMLYALVPMICFGLSNAISKKPTEILGPNRFIIYRGIITTSITGLAALIFFQQINFDLKYLLGGIFITLISYFGLYFFTKSLEIGKVGVVVPVASSRILVSALLGIVFLKDILSVLQIISILIIFSGVVVISINFNDIKNSKIFDKKSGIMFALLAAFFWGSTLPLFGIFSAVLGAFFFAFIVELTVIVEAIIQSGISKKKIGINKEEINSTWKLILIVGTLGALATIFLNFAYSTGEVGVVAAVSGSSSVISVLYGMLVFKEKLSFKQVTAITLIILGIIALSYFSNV